MGRTQDQLIAEEQKVLDQLIKELDRVILKMNNRLTQEKLDAIKAKVSCLPEAYGDIVKSETAKSEINDRIQELIIPRDELYHTRVILNENGKPFELKIGLHTFSKNGKVYIASWLNPACRPLILNQDLEEYDTVVEDKGRIYETHYSLELRRKVDIFFDEVNDVLHMYPILDEEDEKIIADEFLRELANRRAEREFKNIVFSIQKHQGEIIQTPYMQNLIVQGCAGSGKSMIMLHRLPILLYDNPKNLNRNNLYIITPSLAYIQMAENMRNNLEIADLNMGTLEQYYDYVIEKYGHSPDEYGKIKSFLKLDSEKEHYIYSEVFPKDIHMAFHKRIQEAKVDYRLCQRILKMENKASTRNNANKTPSEEILHELNQIQKILFGDDFDS